MNINHHNNINQHNNIIHNMFLDIDFPTNADGWKVTASPDNPIETRDTVTLTCTCSEVANDVTGKMIK